MMKEEDIWDFDIVVFVYFIGWMLQQVKVCFWEICKGEGIYWNLSIGKLQENYQKQCVYLFMKEFIIDEIMCIVLYFESFFGFYEDFIFMCFYFFVVGVNIFGYFLEVNKEEIDEDYFYCCGDNIGCVGIEWVYEKELWG